MELHNSDGELSDRASDFAAGFAFGFFRFLPLPSELKVLRGVSENNYSYNYRNTCGALAGYAACAGWYGAVMISMKVASDLLLK